MKNYLGVFGLIGIFYFGADSERRNIFYEENERNRIYVQACAICKSKENGLSLDGLVEDDLNEDNKSYNKSRKSLEKTKLKSQNFASAPH